MEQMTKQQIVRLILEDMENELIDEEIVQLLLESTATHIAAPEKTTFGQRAADRLAKGAGSWTFVISFILFLTLWIVMNATLLAKAFDPFPFILLNLLLSCLAAIQAPLIMMSQNRQEEKDRQRSQNDYKVNLKAELIIRDIHEMLEEVHKQQRKLLNMLQNAPDETDHLNKA